MRVLRARVDAGAAGLLVTHEPQHAAWADRIVFLRDGAVVDTTTGDGSAADPSTPLFGLSIDLESDVDAGLDGEPSR
jgi:putative ABC transport system ATP-binding protein